MDHGKPRDDTIQVEGKIITVTVMNEVHCGQLAPMPPRHGAPKRRFSEPHNITKLRTSLLENDVVVDRCAGTMAYILDPFQASSSALDLKLEVSKIRIGDTVTQSHILETYYHAQCYNLMDVQHLRLHKLPHCSFNRAMPFSK